MSFSRHRLIPLGLCFSSVGRRLSGTRRPGRVKSVRSRQVRCCCHNTSAVRPSVGPSVSSSNPPRSSLGRRSPLSLGRRLRASTSIPAVSRCRVSPFYAQQSPPPPPLTACLVHRLSTSFLSLDILNRRSVHASKQPCTSAAHCLQLQAPDNSVAVCRRPSPRLSSSHPYRCLMQLVPCRRLGELYTFGTPAQARRRSALCGVEQRAPPIFGRVAISLVIGPHF